ncbi:tRNA-dihydrouridine(20) synthase [NAD(P)+]-like isoform X2 [Portunus trituberculatus]|nr:tRNA-dihydrouridine(20) synthase [NAD(P)+]-like isoform X2 [Portunus trituberculatus]XP_045111327.1 tRNA-dihydrouridine(20) synthase [NAD(P)+]-like isoform X2 [Portunus trituberculatus]XP_045111328.1 tRNA-dihydrouridine(20) synthase [NAD(P)+]-like isoform X2 [Portunus trituberculatus]
MSGQYRGKVIVAPMVRVCTLPFRLLTIDYGTDLVYTEETIDYKMLRSIKRQNDVLGTVDFIDKSDGTVFFRTCERERSKVIFQIGTNDAQRALKVGKMVEPFVAGLDVNMGCPKEFSLKGGMGAALLTQPDKIKSILTTLVQGLTIPVTCKIRILDSISETLELCKLIEECGVAAIGVHGRTRQERPRHPNHNDVIKEIANVLTIPVIANGGSREISRHDDIKKFQQDTGASSVMIARAAMWNCSILRPEGFLPLDTVIEQYLRYCIQYDNPFTYSKYTVQNMLRELQDTPRGKAFLETQTLQEISIIWGLEDYFKSQLAKQNEGRKTLNFEMSEGKTAMPPSADHVKIVEREENGQKVVEMPIQFIRGNFHNADLPKMLLNTHVFRNQLKGPKYSHVVVDKFFSASVTVDGVKYISTLREKSKRYSEQGAAIVFLHAMGLVNKTYGFVPPEGARKYLTEVTRQTAKKDVISNETIRNNDTRLENEDTDCKKRRLEDDNPSVSLNQQETSQETDTSRNTNKSSIIDGAS